MAGSMIHAGGGLYYWPPAHRPNSDECDCDELPDTERLPGSGRTDVSAPAKCECGSGSNTRSGAHSSWCPLWVAP